MSYMPMHNRFAEGFVESAPSGETIDPLSSRIDPAPPADPDFDAVLRHARTARAAAFSAALVGAARFLGIVISRPVRLLTDGLVAWRRRERAAAALYAVDDRTLADLGLRRADIPFILAQRNRDPATGNEPRILRGWP